MFFNLVAATYENVAQPAHNCKMCYVGGFGIGISIGI